MFVKVSGYFGAYNLLKRNKKLTFCIISLSILMRKNPRFNFYNVREKRGQILEASQHLSNVSNSAESDGLISWLSVFGRKGNFQE